MRGHTLGCLSLLVMLGLATGWSPDRPPEKPGVERLENVELKQLEGRWKSSRATMVISGSDAALTFLRQTDHSF